MGRSRWEEPKSRKGGNTSQGTQDKASNGSQISSQDPLRLARERRTLSDLGMPISKVYEKAKDAGYFMKLKAPKP